MADPYRGFDDSLSRRRTMVDDQIRARGVCDERVLDVLLRLPRDAFLPAMARQTAYEDRAMNIGHGQTISQPFIVAYMTEQLLPTPQCTVLEIGTGTGYQTAVLALLCKHVCTVERISELQTVAAEVLARLGIANVTFFTGDGSLGLTERAPFDRIMVTAGAPQVPTPLLNQLVDGGVLVAPVGGSNEQTIVRVVRQGARTVETPLLACRFVKLVGQEGWANEG